jgi:glycosyltransferase involved in cell wall biosynthesis
MVHHLPIPPHGEPAERELEAISVNEKLATSLRAAGPFDLVYERYSLWGTAAMEFAQASGALGVLEVNAPLIDEQRRHRVLVHQQVAETIAWHTFQAADCVCAVSQEVATWARGKGAAAERTVVVPNGVCPQRFSPELPPADPALAAQFTVGFTGSLKPWHGAEQLVEAFIALHRRYGDAQLVIVGDGPQRKALVEQRKQLTGRARKHIHLIGGVSPAEVPAWLTTMSVAVAPYPNLPDFYFSPLKLYEYMAAGRAVVASDIGQMRSVVDHEVNGLLYPAGNVVSLTQQLARLHEDDALANRLGQNARQSVLDGHTWDQVLERTLDAVLTSKPRLLNL